ncbi:MAG: DUF1727 domain-containing protein [Oscillibacter sp.]|nr:DUF1727 domain-containing protein [Oscillibacter sp.]
MRAFLAILICKILRLIGKAVGKGSSLPGKYALKICPDVLRRVKLPEYVIAVTGSNGKTSTVEMIAAILRKSGKTVVYNEEGSNQIEGVATLVLCNSTMGGKMKADVLLLESDERYARLSFRWFHPTHFVITNLYRDQLTRNGHPEWVYDAILPAIHDDTTLVLNADDPLVSRFAQNHGKVKWFGLDRCSVSSEDHRGVYHDGALCPVCGGNMAYDCYHYEHIGHYRCPSCGYRRHKTDFAVTALDLGKGTLTIDGKTEIALAFKSIYNVYNILAAWSAGSLAGVDRETMASVINNYILKNGRMVRFTLGSHRGTLLTSKHENSVAYDTNLGYIANTQKPCQVLVIVDAISRKYFTGETSWLWDIDFDLLSREHVWKVVLCGKYVHDLALRFDYTGIPPEKIACYDTVAQAAGALAEDGGSEEVYVVTCFSDRDKLLSLVQKEEG